MVEQSKPLVCCIMLAHGRREMEQRAIRCYQRQTYPNKRLLILDSTDVLLPGTLDLSATYAEIAIYRVTDLEPGNIGALRNRANQTAIEVFSPEIFVHWDDDDISGPERISQQVALLQESRKECVGYRTLFFVDERTGAVYLYHNVGHHYCLGTSLCYTRRAYEEAQFVETGPHSKNGSDTAFVRRLGGKGLCYGVDGTNRNLMGKGGKRIHPAMIATVHRASTNTARQVVKGLGLAARGELSEWMMASEADADVAVEMWEQAQS